MMYITAPPDSPYKNVLVVKYDYMQTATSANKLNDTLCLEVPKALIHKFIENGREYQNVAQC